MKFHPSIVQTSVPSPLGTIAIAATAQGLAGLWFTEGQRYLPPELAPAPTVVRATQHWGAAKMTDALTDAADQRQTPTVQLRDSTDMAQSSPAGRSAAWPSAPDHPVLRQAREQLAAYFAGQRRHFELPLDLSSGTAFQQAVWQALLTIAPGETQSYGAISRLIGQPSAVRAVGAAVGRNPISIIVPCHRVMGANGALTGYAGGLARKTALLRLEGALPEMLV